MDENVPPEGSLLNQRPVIIVMSVLAAIQVITGTAYLASLLGALRKASAKENL